MGKFCPSPTNKNLNQYIPASAGITVYPHGTKDFNSLPVSFPSLFSQG